MNAPSLLLLVLLSAPALAQSYSWAGPVSGTWGSPVFWSPSTGFPNGPGTTATLSNTAGPYDVILDGNYSVDQFTHNGTGNFTANSRSLTVNGNSTLAGDSMIFNNANYISNGTVAHNFGPIDMIDSDFIGSGTFFQSGGIINFQSGSITLNGSQTGGTLLFTGGCDLSGGFNNIGGTIDIVGRSDTGLSATLNIGASTLENSGTIKLRSGFVGTSTPNATLTGTSGSLINYGAGSISVEAGTGGSRNIDVSIDNQGAIGSNTHLAVNRPNATHANSGSILFTAGDLDVDSAESFNNSGTIQTSLGSLDFDGNGSGTSIFSNTATGTLTATSGITIGGFLDVSNAGVIQPGGNFTLLGSGFSVVSFDHSGSLTVPPGSSFTMSSSSGSSQFILQPGATFVAGDSLNLTGTNLVLNQGLNLGSAGLSLVDGGVSGPSTLTTGAGTTASLDEVILTAPVTNHATMTVADSGNGFYGSFENSMSGSLSLDSSIDGFAEVILGNSDLTNHGQFAITGNTTTRMRLANGNTSTGKFINEATGTATISGTGTRDLDVPVDNRGILNINTNTITDGVANAVHANSGTVNLNANWTLQSPLSFSNSGILNATTGELYVSATGLAGTLFENSGTMNLDTDTTLLNFENHNIGGALNVNAGTTLINVGANLVDRFLTLTGDAEVAPGATLTLNGPGGKDDGFMTFEPGFSLDGGGQINHTALTTTLNADWNPGTSPVSFYQSTLTGTGTLLPQNGSIFRIRGSQINTPVVNHATTTVERGGTTSQNYLYGAFENAADGSLTIDSSIEGFAEVILGNNDLTNHGQFELTGDTTTRMRLANGNTSTGKFVNETTGTATISGTGPRDFDVPVDNRGVLNINTNTNSDGVANAVHVNSGTLNLNADWSVQAPFSFTNSGILNATTGELYVSATGLAGTLFENSGTMNLDTDTTLLNFENHNISGALNINAGTTLINVGANLVDRFLTLTGDAEVAQGATLTLNGPGGKDDGFVLLEPGSSLDGGGQINLANVTTTLNADWNPGEASLDVSFASLNGSGALTIPSIGMARFRTVDLFGEVTNQGTSTIEAAGAGSSIFSYLWNSFSNETGGSLSIDSSSGLGVILRAHNATITNAGQAAIMGPTTAGLRSYTTSSNPVFHNLPGGTLEITGSGSRDCEVSVNNEGTVTVSTSCNFGDTSPLTNSTNTGTFVVETGATASLAGNFSNETGGTLGGSGTFSIGTGFSNDGTISPGNSVGALTITGSPTLNPTSVFDMEIDGTGNDFLQVNGNLGLTGTLRILPINGYIPSDGDSFVIMQSSGTLSGGFSAVVQPFAFGEFIVDVDETNKQVTLTFDLTGPLSYADFQSLYFSPAQITNGDADRGNDFDGDGLTNEMEWIHGLDPTDPVIPVPPFRIERDGGNVELTFLESNLLPPSIEVDLLTTTDLFSLPQTIPPASEPRVSEVPLPGFPDTDEVTLQISNPSWTGSDRRFFQLEFTETAP